MANRLEDGLDADFGLDDPGDRGDQSASTLRERLSIRQVSKIPLFFLGIGVYRAWIELSYVRPLVDVPAWDIAGHDVYDIAMIVVLFACAAAARYLEPIMERKWVLYLTGVLMVAGTVLVFLTYYLPDISGMVAYPAAVASGMGTALVILLWSELYGCLNATRVALYYSGSLILGAFIIFICRGFVDSYQIGATVLLPVISLIFLKQSYCKIPEQDRPRHEWARFSFPWKPVLLMAVYAFAYGICERRIYITEGPHSSIGTVIAAAVVFVGVMSYSKRFDLSVTFRIALPTMVCGLLIPLFFPDNALLADIFVFMSYSSFSILIMLILATLCYRWKVSAVWLFGIERGLRALVTLLGRYTQTYVAGSLLDPTTKTTILMLIVVVAVVAATAVLMSERDLTSKWGITFLGADDEEGGGGTVARQNDLAELCLEFSQRGKLSHREGEVLFLLAQGKSISDVERELFIANGTVKAHVRHIYEKLGIHSRAELFELLGLGEAEARQAASGAGQVTP